MAIAGIGLRVVGIDGASALLAIGVDRSVDDRFVGVELLGKNTDEASFPRLRQAEIRGTEGRRAGARFDLSATRFQTRSELRK